MCVCVYVFADWQHATKSNVFTAHTGHHVNSLCINTRWCIFTRSHFFSHWLSYDHTYNLWTQLHTDTRRHTSALVKMPQMAVNRFLWAGLDESISLDTFFCCFLFFFLAFWQDVGLFLHTPSPLFTIAISLCWQGPDTSNSKHQKRNFSDLLKSRCKA